MQDSFYYLMICMNWPTRGPVSPTVASELLEGMFFLDYSANTQSTRTLLHTRIAEGFGALCWVFGELFTKNMPSNVSLATVSANTKKRNFPSRNILFVKVSKIINTLFQGQWLRSARENGHIKVYFGNDCTSYSPWSTWLPENRTISWYKIFSYLA